jgi:hypothetical protein
MTVSVIIPLYNKAAYIARTLDSVFAQSFTDYEIVVIDDGSTDGGGEIVRRIADPRVRLITQPNAGQGAARDRGMREAHGDLFVFLDADDEWRPDCLAHLTALVRDFPQAGAAGVRYAMVNHDGTLEPARVSGLPAGFTRGLLPDYYACALLDPPLWSSSTAIPRRTFEELRPAASPAKFGEDLFLWSQIANRYPVAYDTAVQALYHREAEGRVMQTCRETGEMPVVTLLRRGLADGTVADTPAVRAYVSKLQLETLSRMLAADTSLDTLETLFAACARTPATRTAWWWTWDQLLRRRVQAHRGTPLDRALLCTRSLWRPVQKLIVRFTANTLDNR